MRGALPPDHELRSRHLRGWRPQKQTLSPNPSSEFKIRIAMRQRKHQRCRLLCLLSTLLAASLLVVDGGIESFFVPQGDTSSNAGQPATFFLLATRMPPEFNQYSCQVQIIWPHLSPFRIVYMSVSYMQLLQTCCKSNRNRTPMRRCEILSQVRPTCSFRVHQYRDWFFVPAGTVCPQKSQ